MQSGSEKSPWDLVNGQVILLTSLNSLSTFRVGEEGEG
jgi:hypothetical protein